jgi:hypothetical protein
MPDFVSICARRDESVRLQEHWVFKHLLDRIAVEARIGFIIFSGVKTFGAK